MAQWAQATMKAGGNAIPKAGPVRNAMWDMRLAVENIALRCRLGADKLTGNKRRAEFAGALGDNYAVQGFRARKLGNLEEAAEKYCKSSKFIHDESQRRVILRSYADCLSRIAESYERGADYWAEKFRGTGHSGPAQASETAATKLYVNEPLRKKVVALFSAASCRKSAGEAFETLGDTESASGQYQQGYASCQAAVATLCTMSYYNEERHVGIDMDFSGQILTVDTVFSLRQELVGKLS